MIRKILTTIPILLIFILILMTKNGDINNIVKTAVAADNIRAKTTLDDYKKIRKIYSSLDNKSKAAILKLRPIELRRWFGDHIKLLSTHDINRKKDVYHSYAAFIWQNIGDKAYLVIAGKKFGRDEKLLTYNACANSQINDLSHFKDAKINRHHRIIGREAKCQMISVLTF